MLKGQKRPPGKYKPANLYRFILVRGHLIPGQRPQVLAEADEEEEARAVHALLRPAAAVSCSWWYTSVQDVWFKKAIPRPDIGGGRLQTEDAHAEYERRFRCHQRDKREGAGR
jgi:hypothetical protein